jgi:hypothetical protein
MLLRTPNAQLSPNQRNGAGGRMSTRQWVIMIIFFLCSCGNGLSRSKAENLISKRLALPSTHTTKLRGYYSKRFWSDPVSGFGTITICRDDGIQFSDVQRQLNEWQASGLIKMTETSSKTGRCHSLGVTPTLTDEGKKYLVSQSDGVSEVKAYDLEFGEVTGIQINEQLKVAEVDYTLNKVNITPFGWEPVTQITITRKAVFRLFDDGWRISQ